MGEAKCRSERMTPFELAMQGLQRKLADEGKTIEAGWIALRTVWIPPDAPEDQVRDLRWAYMAGAQHLFSSIMTIMDPGDEPTDADLKRMDLIAEELEAFGREMAASLPTEGRA